MENCIRLDNINKSFGKKQVLFDVSLKIPKGCIFGLLGPSGCGKTTSVKIMAGILKQDSGSAYIMGGLMPDLSLMAQMGYMAQSAALYPTLSAYENLKFFGSVYGFKGHVLVERIDKVTDLVGLTHELKKTVSAYSEGMKQRLSLAIALLPDPKVLLLDEPTVGIDPVLRKSIWKELYYLSDQGVTILVTTHVMDEAGKCHRLAMMREGVFLAEGTPSEIIEKSGAKTIEDAFIYFGRGGGSDED
ncbi:MAG TPA: ABC transporter ATP-binding protein [Bacillota bacterium]|nr:ABC transporter ATP-binding protein [Bacillota bacterium]